MDATHIIYPMVVMFFLTMLMIFVMGICRFLAIHKRQVSVKYYRTYDEGQQPKYLVLLARHVQNHFEVPPLFHIGCLLAYVSNNVTVMSVSFAWAFVLLRLLHSAIHLGGNNVSRRFFCFGASLLALCGLWGSLALAVLS